MSKETFIPNRLKKASQISLSVIALAGASCSPFLEMSEQPRVTTHTPSPTEFLADINLLVQSPCGLLGRGKISTEGYIQLSGESSSMTSDSNEPDRTIHYQLHTSQNPDSRFINITGRNPKLDPNQPAPVFEEKVKVTGEIVKTELGQDEQCFLDVISIQE